MSQSPQHAGVATAQLDLGDPRIQFVGVPGADEVRLVSGAADDDRFVALYRRGDRLTGALTLNGQAVVMKYRNLIAKEAGWSDALAFAEKRNAAAAPAA